MTYITREVLSREIMYLKLSHCSRMMATELQHGIDQRRLTVPLSALESALTVIGIKQHKLFVRNVTGNLVLVSGVEVVLTYIINYQN